MKLFILPAVAVLLATSAYAQDKSIVLPDGSTLSIDKSPGEITVSKEGEHLSWSHTVSHNGSVSAAANASATGTNFAYARASATTSAKENANGKSIDIARARAVRLAS